MYVSCPTNFAEQALSHSLPALHKRGPGAAPNWGAEDLLKASVKNKTRIYKLRNSSNQIIKVTKSMSSNSLQVIFSWRTYGHISSGEVLYKTIRKCSLRRGYYVSNKKALMAGNYIGSEFYCASPPLIPTQSLCADKPVSKSIGLILADCLWQEGAVPPSRLISGQYFSTKNLTAVLKTWKKSFRLQQ